MQDIAIYGAGGLGREVACLLRIINEHQPTWNLIGFYDDGKEIGSRNEYGTVLGGINELNSITRPLAIVIAIASPKVITKIVNEIASPLVEYPNLIAPNTMFLDKENVSFGRGNLICDGCTFSCNVHVGDFNIFDWNITIGHDTTIGSCNVLMPGVRISGEVTIGQRNLFGASCVVLQQLFIGNDTIMGANSTVIRETCDNRTYVGTPATIVERAKI
jgi:sugar O-acyltransferase (sialic acid O-acetyltransferase NeuD family)